jgi:hypothetical protein
MAVPQSDIYALGVILYEMLTGSVPFDDLSPASVAVQHMTQPPPAPRRLNPRLNQATEKVLLKVLSKQPEDRHQTGAGLLDALAEALQASAEELLPLSPPSMTTPEPSQVSLVERVGQYVLPLPVVEGASEKAIPRVGPPAARSAPTVVYPPEAPTSAATKKKPSSVLWIAAGGAIILLLAAGWVLFGSGDRETAEIIGPDLSPTPFVSEAAEATEADALLPPSPETTTTGAAETKPTEPVRGESTVSEATETPILEQANPPTEVAPAAEPTATPSGPRLVIFYDPNSFYVYNPDRETDIRVSQLTFESLDENGELSGYWFEGRRWSLYYSYVESLGCVSLEITTAESWLRPSQCRKYNATITPGQNSDMVFWTQRPGVAQFRVLWQGQEIGRCELDANKCEAYLP